MPGNARFVAPSRHNLSMIESIIKLDMSGLDIYTKIVLIVLESIFSFDHWHLSMDKHDSRANRRLKLVKACPSAYQDVRFAECRIQSCCICINA